MLWNIDQIDCVMFTSAEEIMTTWFVTSASGHNAFVILEQTLREACSSSIHAILNLRKPDGNAMLTSVA
ncbi:hypothetical protein H9L39_19111 [Fusarium oxysporum f. sp. albedinis]|nr:hypothetical protein H9L39_19111 [Fusarium oxysporum f. sp. albedinis]